MSNISVIKFAKEKVFEVFNPNQKYHKWDNADTLLELYNTIPEHSSAIDYIVDLIVANGIDDLDYWTLQKAVLDYIIFGGFVFQIIKTRGGETIKNYVDISKCRFSAEKDKVGYSDKWNTCKSEIKWYPIVKDSTKEGMFYFKNNKSRDIYPRPYYISSHTSLNTMKSIIDYHYNNASNGFAPNVVINFNGGDPGEEVKEKIEKSIEDKFTGENGKKFILSFNDSEETKTTIEKLDNDNLDQKFETLQKFLQEQIFISHKLTSGCLIGKYPEGSGFSKTEYEESLDVFKRTTIKSLSMEMEYALSMLFGKDIKIKQEQVIKPMEETTNE